jgi:hypothetical protein
MSEQWAVGLYLTGIKCRVMGPMRIGIDRGGDSHQRDGVKCRVFAEAGAPLVDRLKGSLA